MLLLTPGPIPTFILEEETGDKPAAPSRTHEAYSPVANVSSSTYLLVIMLRFNLLKPNDIYIYIYIYIYMSYRSANLPTLHFKYLFNKYTY